MVRHDKFSSPGRSEAGPRDESLSEAADDSLNGNLRPMPSYHPGQEGRDHLEGPWRGGGGGHWVLPWEVRGSRYTLCFLTFFLGGGAKSDFCSISNVFIQ